LTKDGSGGRPLSSFVVDADEDGLIFAGVVQGEVVEA
jgi:hypothetical protein